MAAPQSRASISSSSGLTSKHRPLVAVPPILLRPPEAAAAMGMSEEYFNANVRPDVRSIRGHRMRLYPVAELERWALENATPVV